ncbi:hypothetical protein MKX01_012053, partial [Papaver californicum]
MEANQNSSGIPRSTTISSQKNVSSSSTKPKILVEVNVTGKTIGDTTSRFATREGELIR